MSAPAEEAGPEASAEAAPEAAERRGPTAPAPGLTTRIAGLDLARGIAVLGMVFVNFHVMMSNNEGAPWLRDFLIHLEGRAAALFIILAGCGVSLATRRPERIPQVRPTLLKRALFLLVVGYAWSPIWEGDILHFYGFYIGIGCLLLTRPASWLWQVAAWCIAGFTALYFVGDYWADWDLEDLTYPAFWHPVGQLRNIIFNGWYPLLPWMAFFAVGMWLGRQPLRDEALRRRLFLVGLEIAIGAELLSRVLTGYIDAFMGPLLENPYMATLYDMFRAEPLPPSPLFMLAGGGSALAVAIGCLWIAERWPRATLPLTAAGQLAFSLYVGHVYLGIWPLERFGFVPIPIVMLRATLFCAAALLFATVWRRYFARGPIEWVMRRLCG